MSEPNQELQLAPAEPQALEMSQREPTAIEMMQEFLKRGVTKENVEVFGKLVDLQERMQARDAEKQFAAAFVRLQMEIPKIIATKEVPDKYGKKKFAFAPFEQIDKQARPICLANGFTYTFSEGESTQGKITKLCTLQHIGGHKRTNPYTVRIGSGPPGCTESQSDGAAHSYAKRGALCDCLNIVVIGQDNDARAEGGPISAAQVAGLKRRVAATGSNEVSFLAFAGAASYELIPEGKYATLDAFLTKKEQVVQRRAAAPAKATDTITKDQAAALRKRVREAGADEADFLDHAEAVNFECILVSKLAIMEAALAKLEKTT